MSSTESLGLLQKQMAVLGDETKATDGSCGQMEESAFTCLFDISEKSVAAEGLCCPWSYTHRKGSIKPASC